jgi:hypothetical protein
MGLVERDTLLSQISPPFDHLLASQLIDEFISMERRYIQRDWEPMQLDGGQFAEIAARILYHQDSGILNLSKGYDECVKYLENDKTLHKLSRREVLHLCKVLRVIYKFRSQRGCIHISPTYFPNHMDSKLLIECVRWSMNELLRIFWSGGRDEVAKAINELLQFDVPCIGKYGDLPYVQRTDLKADQEILLLLHYAGMNGYSRRELGQYCLHPAQRISEAISNLKSNQLRQITQINNGNYVLTDLGNRRIRNELASKLLLQ